MIFTENRDSNKKRIVLIIIIIIAALVFIGASAAIISHFLPEKGGELDKYKNNVSNSSAGPNAGVAENPIDFDAVKSANADVCAWIKVDGTPIDYPILQSGEDKEEDYYLTHDMNGIKKTAASIYIQRVNLSDFTDYNTIIYGHNMLNGSMFGTLKKFRNAQFFNENRNIYIYIPKHVLRYDIVSAFLYDDRHVYNSFNFNTSEGRQAFIDTVMNPESLVKNVKNDADIAVDDKLITLSTCASKPEDRYLVVGRLVEDTPTK